MVEVLYHLKCREYEFVHCSRILRGKWNIIYLAYGLVLQGHHIEMLQERKEVNLCCRHDYVLTTKIRSSNMANMLTTLPLIWYQSVFLFQGIFRDKLAKHCKERQDIVSIDRISPEAVLAFITMACGYEMCLSRHVPDVRGCNIAGRCPCIHVTNCLPILSVYIIFVFAQLSHIVPLLRQIAVMKTLKCQPFTLIFSLTVLPDNLLILEFLWSKFKLFLAWLWWSSWPFGMIY